MCAIIVSKPKTHSVMNVVPSIQLVNNLVTTQDAERLLEWARGINAVIPGFVIPVTLLQDHFTDPDTDTGPDEPMECAFCLNEVSDNMLASSLNKHAGNTAYGCIGPDLRSLLESGALIIGATWVSHEQFIENTVWPQVLGRDDPYQIKMIFFRNNHATLGLLEETTTGTLIWEKESIEFSGTWQEVYQRLVDMHRGGYPFAGVSEFKPLDA